MSNMLTTKEVMTMLKVDRSTVWRWRLEGMPHRIIGKNSVRFVEAEVLAWVNGDSIGGERNER